MELSIFSKLTVSDELLTTRIPFGLFLLIEKFTFFTFKNECNFNSFNFS